MRKIILTLLVLGAGLSAIAQNTYGLDDGNARATRRQKSMSAWQKDMDEFKARSAHDRQLNALADSLASVQGRAALVNQDFVLEATSVTFKNGTTKTASLTYSTKIEANKVYDLTFVTAITDVQGSFTVDVVEVVHDEIEF